MRRRTKGLLAVLIIIAVTVPSILLVINSILNPPPPEALNLDEAPADIRAKKADLKYKLSQGTFTWEDMDNFTIFSEYVAANQYEAQSIVTGWTITAVLDIIDTGYLWFVVKDDVLDLEALPEPPEEPDVTITLAFETIVEVFSCQTTAAAAFQRGDVDFDGTLNIALKIDRLNTIFSYAIMDEKIYYSSGVFELKLTEDDSTSHTPGLTLFPCIEVILTNESAEVGAMGAGKVLIIDNTGEIVAYLEDSRHSVHKFINSTAIMMGGSDGWMEIWDFRSNKRQTLPVPAGHHELDYNPITDTFMVLETATTGEMWDGLEVIYDTISEYSWEGELLWQWDARVHYPFNSTIYTTIGHNYTFRGYADWMHANSFVWDKVHDTILLNVRNQDTILKIDKATGNILWSAGRNGNFTIYDTDGVEVDSFWHYPHSLEWVGSNNYILFDNGLYDPEVPSSMERNGTGKSGFVQFEIDEVNQEVKEVWSWHSSNSSYYFSESGGDADRLPDGNTIGIFANKALVLAEEDPVIFTEVAPDGTIVWELQVLGGDGTYYWAHRLERFYETPLVEVQDSSLELDEHSLWINCTVWNCVKENFASDGELKVIVDGSELYSSSFEFQPQWIPTSVEASLDNLPDTVNYIELRIINSDGIEKSVAVYGLLPGMFDSSIIFLPLLSVCIIIPLIIIYTKRSVILSKYKK